MPQKNNFFSVVIATYNRSELLREALQSVCAQEEPDFEVIVVDDGSTEGIAAVVRGVDCRFRCVRQENRGPGPARNLGMACATGEYIAFLDSDDLWFPWTLAVYRQVVRQAGLPALVTGALFPFRDPLALGQVTRDRLQMDYFSDFLAASKSNLYASSSQMLVRRDLAMKGGGFSDRDLNAEDHDFALRLGTDRGFVRVRRPAMIAYRLHSANVTADLRRTTSGIDHLFASERAGRYPGGAKRRADRLRLITMHCRPVSLALMDRGDRRDAWRLYLAALGWHLRLGRWRYVVGFPLRAAARALAGRGTRYPGSGHETPAIRL